MDVYAKMKELGLEIQQPTPLGGIYSPVRFFGEKLVYTSGTGGEIAGYESLVGRVGGELTLEQGQEMARRCVLNILSNLHHNIGDLNRIKKFVKILAFVNSANNFYQQPAEVDGASALIRNIFGEEAGLPARSAIGVNVLPGNIPVEIEILLELE